jgi:MurNAc alpha-1-phosphate uridylyltransferase
MPDAVMILAAGFGTRMGALTAERPKPLIEVAGRPLIDHALALGEGLTRVVNAHYRADQIVAHLRGTDVAVAVEAPEILDSGGGLKAARPLLGSGPVFTLNADAVWHGPNPLEVLRAAWVPETMQALLLCVPLTRAHGRQNGGDFALAPDGRLAWGGDHVFTGAQILRMDLLDGIDDTVFPMRRLWDRAANRGGFRGTLYPGHWADVGHPGGILAAEAMLADV